MRLPKDISGAEIAKKLEKFGYCITRQTGSHLRLTTKLMGEHHLTIPNHPSIRIGTFSSILNDVAKHFKKTKEQIIIDLFE